MLINLFKTLKDVGVPCTLRELLDLIAGLEKHVVFADINVGILYNFAVS